MSAPLAAPGGAERRLGVRDHEVDLPVEEVIGLEIDSRGAADRRVVDTEEEAARGGLPPGGPPCRQDTREPRESARQTPLDTPAADLDSSRMPMRSSSSRPKKSLRGGRVESSASQASRSMART